MFAEMNPNLNDREAFLAYDLEKQEEAEALVEMNKADDEKAKKEEKEGEVLMPF